MTQTHSAVHLTTTVPPSTNSNHASTVQTLRPAVQAQIFANARLSTSAVIVQQPVQLEPIPTPVPSSLVQGLPAQLTVQMPMFTMPVKHILPTLSA